MNSHRQNGGQLAGVTFIGLGLLLATLAGCGSAIGRRSLPQTVTPDGRTIYGTLPLGPTERQRLTWLPPVATYRWGLPGDHFSGTTPVEDSASARFEMHELRMASTDVLRMNGWREARADEAADFEIAVLRVERSAEWFESQPDPRAQLPDPRSCRNLPPAQRANCVEPMPRDYPPVKVLQRGTDARVAFAIMRVSDSATAWWIVPSSVHIHRQTLELLHAGASGTTALNP